MELAERITQLEDAVINLSFIMEQRQGAYRLDVNRGIHLAGQSISDWADAVRIDRHDP